MGLEGRRSDGSQIGWSAEASGRVPVLREIEASEKVWDVPWPMRELDGDRSGADGAERWGGRGRPGTIAGWLVLARSVFKP